MVYILIFFIGSAVGSTMGAFIYRRDNIKSFIFGRSRCEFCNRLIPLYLNIPIFSYIILKARCKFCKNTIPIINLAYELLTGILFLLLYKRYGVTINFFIRSAEVIIILIISFTDIENHEIYIKDVIVLLIFEFIYKILNNSIFLSSFIVMFCVFSVYYLIFKLIKAIGEGDIYFAMVCSFFCNNYLEGFYIFKNSFIIASIFSVFLILLKYKDKKDEIAFCPYIAISLFMVIL